MTGDPSFATIAELSRMLQKRQISSVELVRAAIERTNKYDKRLNSYITFLPDAALEWAKQADAEMASGHYRGVLHGIPFSTKDHIATAGIPTSAGAKSRLKNIPAKDAAVTRRMKLAGAVLMGKANMNKFAGGESGDNPDFGKIRNPWNTEYSPGGSSGGSGAQVAAGLVPLSIGSDNGGSVRIPAALCGITGLKPTHGRISLEGIHPRLYSLDHPGPLTRSVEDCAISLQALAGHDAGDTTTALKTVPDYAHGLRLGIRGLRVAVDRKYAAFGEPDVLTAFGKALDQLTQLGARLFDIVIPDLNLIIKTAFAVAGPEFLVAAADLYRDHPEDFEQDDHDLFRAGALVPAAEYIRANQQRRLLKIAFAQATTEADVFVSPTYPLARRPFGSYPRVQGREFTFEDAIRYSFPFDLLGLPAITTPCGFSGDGMPVGIQFVGKAFDEPTVLKAAWAYEQAAGWQLRHPSLN